MRYAPTDFDEAQKRADEAWAEYEQTPWWWFSKRRKKERKACLASARYFSMFGDKRAAADMLDRGSNLGSSLPK